MSAGISPPRIDGPGLRRIRQRFLSISRARIERVRHSLTPRQQLFVELLPLLFHVNHPLMPGYVTKDTPSGVSGYAPNQRTLLAATKQARTFPVVKRAVRTVDIYGIYLMGSSGSIGYSIGSDLDVWICHRPELDDKQLERLREKCHGIIRWSAKLGLEVHLYPLVAEDFYTSKSLSTSIEDDGKIQTHFLLDEFYRTGLLVAGRYPLWWLVPPRFEDDYASYVTVLKSRRFVKPYEFLDFGPVANFPPEEFLSAALWQLSKSIVSPNKSLLKVLLLESYAKQYPQANLLSLRYKSTVYSGKTELDAVDPYILLWEEVESYLRSKGDFERLELSRRCFYSKVHEPLSQQSSAAAVSWRRRLLRKLVDQWGWDKSYTRSQDDRDEWKIDRVLAERRAVTTALTAVYRTLSDFAHRYPSAAAINTRDACLLGRKLLLAFEHKAGKVEIISQDISRDLTEACVSIYQLPTSRSECAWLLFRDVVKVADLDKHQPLARFPSLVELLVWCHLNGVINWRSRVVLLARESYTWGKEVNDACRYLRQYFSRSSITAPNAATLSNPPHLRSVGVLINFGSDPLEAYTKNGTYLSSQRTDALNYSSVQTNLVRRLDYVAVNSWGQVQIQHFAGVGGLLACLCLHLQNSLQQPLLPPSAVSFYCWNAGYGRLVSQRVSQLFTDLRAWVQRRESAAHGHYILQVGGDFHALERAHYSVRHVVSGDYQEVLAYFVGREHTGSMVTVDRYAEREYFEFFVNATSRNYVTLEEVAPE